MSEGLKLAKASMGEPKALGETHVGEDMHGEVKASMGEPNVGEGMHARRRYVTWAKYVNGTMVMIRMPVEG